MRPGTPGSALTSSDDPVKTQAAKLRFNGSRTSTEWDPTSSTQSVTSLPQDDSAGARPKNQYPLTPTTKLSSTHDLKTKKMPRFAPNVVQMQCKPLTEPNQEHEEAEYEPVPSPLPSPRP